MPRHFGPPGRPRGPPPFVVQILRAPLMLNNIVALSMTLYVRGKQSGMKNETAFNLLMALFAMSIGHNILSIIRFHRIRREVFGESMCAARKRWRQRGNIALEQSEEEREALMLKFKEMGRRMPNLVLAMTDVVHALAFLALFIWTSVVAEKWCTIKMGVAYSTIGALVAFVFNLLVGLGGVKMWKRQQKKQQDAKLEAVGVQDLDVKEKLLEN